MPHHFISGMEDISNHSSHKRVSTGLKLNDPAQVASTRAELHRRSIAQMRVCYFSFVIQLPVRFVSCTI
jgi:hypothetical protein